MLLANFLVLRQFVELEKPWPVIDHIDMDIEGQMTINRKLDTDETVYFYEQDFYVLSNFSAFTLHWKGIRFDTSEAAYHWEKFPHWPSMQEDIRCAPSAHEAFKRAEAQKEHRRPDWDAVKISIMRDILRAKVQQHEYVKRKLLQTGDRELVEDSWRDGFWGWDADRRGLNMLGNLWMEIRDEVRAAEAEAVREKEARKAAYGEPDFTF